MNDRDRHLAGDDRAHERHEAQRADLPNAVDLPPSPGNAFGDDTTGSDVDVDRSAGGGLEGSGDVDLHGSDEGLHQGPVDDDPVSEAGRDFMDLDRSRHA